MPVIRVKSNLMNNKIVNPMNGPGFLFYSSTFWWGSWGQQRLPTVVKLKMFVFSSFLVFWWANKGCYSWKVSISEESLLVRQLNNCPNLALHFHLFIFVTSLQVTVLTSHSSHKSHCATIATRRHISLDPVLLDPQS